MWIEKQLKISPNETFWSKHWYPFYKRQIFYDLLITILYLFIFLAKLWCNPSVPDNVRADGEQVLCLHGFQDNCVSFERLISLLDDRNTYLCLDWPNHGRSSSTPLGVRWTMENYVVTVKRVADHHLRQQWSKVPSKFVCLGHSMGGQIGKLFSAVYPDHVKKLVILDTAGPIEMYPDEIVSCKRRALDELLRIENRIWSSDPTTACSPTQYTRTEALDRIKRRMHSNDTLTRLPDVVAEMLMDRYFRPGPTPDKYLLANDQRLRVTYSDWFSAEQHQNVVSNIKCPTLLIRATDSDSYYNDIYGIFVKMYEQRPNFQIVKVKGNHDVHMEHPHRVAPLINKFINNSLSKL